MTHLLFDSRSFIDHLTLMNKAKAPFQAFSMSVSPSYDEIEEEWGMFDYVRGQSALRGRQAARQVVHLLKLWHSVQAVWPPRQGNDYVRSEEFLELMTMAAKQVIARHPDLGCDVSMGVAVAFEWFDRQIKKNPDAFSKFMSKRRLRSFAFKLIFHEGLRTFRSRVERGRSHSLVEVPDPQGAESIERVDRADLLRVVYLAIKALPRDMRSIVKLRLIKGLSNNDAARHEGIAAYQASRLYKRALQALTKDLENKI